MLTKTIHIIGILLLLPLGLMAAPAISGVSGTVSHGETITISGSGFGTKSTAAPTLWDDCSGTDPTDLWSWMNPSSVTGDSDTTKNLTYRTPAQVNNVALPHTHITKYLCGNHYASIGDGGSDVYPVLYHDLGAAPARTYISWYRRFDPNWDWGSGDKNCKDFAWSDAYGTGPSDGTPYSDNLYISHWPDETYPVEPPDYLGAWAGTANLTFSTSLEHKDLTAGWVKTEIEAYWATSGGYIKIWEDGVLKMEATGATWTGDGPQCIGLEGYFRNYGTNNCWRYMADIYIDYSAQRVLIGNADTLAECTTLRAVQIPSAWSDTSITVKVNQDAFADSATAYLYVFDASGESNATGTEITFGSEPAPALQPTIRSGGIVNGVLRP